MEAVGSSKTFSPVYQTSQHYIPEDSHHQCRLWSYMKLSEMGLSELRVSWEHVMFSSHVTKKDTVSQDVKPPCCLVPQSSAAFHSLLACCCFNPEDGMFPQNASELLPGCMASDPLILHNLCYVEKKLFCVFANELLRVLGPRHWTVLGESCLCFLKHDLSSACKRVLRVKVKNVARYVCVLIPVCC
jgi:hypothetical protein